MNSKNTKFFPKSPSIACCSLRNLIERFSPVECSEELFKILKTLPSNSESKAGGKEVSLKNNLNFEETFLRQRNLYRKIIYCEGMNVSLTR